ncbi:methylenetetrahydrofolate reductase [NAD(P)H] [Limnobacter humi]|uniref:Methylenetetrahydrofolate reductase n=1 Tax=Limnobacter humi TaxID=1778671 RepID=A0ABT1WD84_9BURK|nr:methylenetetrahydrofolate reductase [NAD(P)H] [Limnobacter humi]MCQ8894833.1 methylenetetrahydrofolate reductase [NAD(P)H] [Limnobacter humi]
MNISFEFFPAKTDEGTEKLKQTRAQLAERNPEFFSVTFGAGGTTQDGTLSTVLDIQTAGNEAAPHLSCIGSSKDKVRDLLNTYKGHGIRRIVALRGDLPSGMLETGSFRYASELVEFIRAETGNHFFIEVAAYPETHPQARSAMADVDAFVHKVKCGANSAITQYFFNADAFLYFRDQVQTRVDIPLVPGIMPITNFSQLARFSDACGAELPRWVRNRLQQFGDDRDAIRSFGLDVVTGLCERLIREGVPGLHFYTMNNAQPTLSILDRLGL